MAGIGYSWSQREKTNYFQGKDKGLKSKVQPSASCRFSYAFAHNTCKGLGGYCSYTALWCPGSLSRDHHKAQPCASQTLQALRHQAPGHGPLQFSSSPLKWGPKRGHCTPAVGMPVPGKGKVHGESTGKALWASASSCRPMHGAHHPRPHRWVSHPRPLAVEGGLNAR